MKNEYIIKNTNNNKFMVVNRIGLCETLATFKMYNTYEEAYKTAKAYCFKGNEPIDETKHH